MAVLDGCESKYRTPVPKERTCPKCGKIVEVFTVRGRIMEDAKCPCGYVFSAEEPDTLVVEKKEEEEKLPPEKICTALCYPFRGTSLSLVVFLIYMNIKLIKWNFNSICIKLFFYSFI